jgi:GGDEF domain-containing protein
VSSAPQPSDYHDALTELPNRRLFDDRLKQALHLVGRRDSGIALILIVLAGSSTAPDDTVARWGAAEFAVILTDVTDEAQCRIAAERLLTALDMDVAMGISRFPADALDAAALVRNADAARGRARQLGRRHYRLYAR